ncbi:MAG: ABC transporter permease [Geminicoccaceae bacterium]
MAERVFSVRRMPGFTPMAILVFVVLYAPIVILATYSFNAGTSLAIWEGFSLRWYASAWQDVEVQAATFRSFGIATVAAIVSSILATMAAIATTRTAAFRGQTFVLAMINLPLMAPEIVTAIALLICFALVKIATGYAGLGYIVLAHTAFCVPFAFLPIRGRLEDMDQSLETAAADLYATPWQAFRYVTLPLLWPGILAGFMLAFVTSLDDVVITNLIAGPGQETLPIYMLGQLRRSTTPEINAVSTALLAISVLLVSLSFLLSREKE